MTIRRHQDTRDLSKRCCRSRSSQFAGGFGTLPETKRSFRLPVLTTRHRRASLRKGRALDRSGTLQPPVGPHPAQPKFNLFWRCISRGRHRSCGMVVNANETGTVPGMRVVKKVREQVNATCLATCVQGVGFIWPPPSHCDRPSVAPAHAA